MFPETTATNMNYSGKQAEGNLALTRFYYLSEDGMKVGLEWTFQVNSLISWTGADAATSQDPTLTKSADVSFKILQGATTLSLIHISEPTRPY